MQDEDLNNNENRDSFSLFNKENESYIQKSEINNNEQCKVYFNFRYLSVLE